MMKLEEHTIAELISNVFNQTIAAVVPEHLVDSFIILLIDQHGYPIIAHNKANVSVEYLNQFISGQNVQGLSELGWKIARSEVSFCCGKTGWTGTVGISFNSDQLNEKDFADFVETFHRVMKGKCAVVKQQHENLQVFLQQLKGLFFDLVTTPRGHESFSELMGVVLSGLKEKLILSEITLYSYNKWKDCYYPDYTTDSNVSESIENSILTGVEWQHLAGSECKEHGMIDASSRFEDGIDYKYFYVALTRCPEEQHDQFILMYKLPARLLTPAIYELLAGVSQLLTQLMKKANQYYKLMHEEKRYEQMYRVTSKFHSSMNIDIVLDEIVETLQKVYPEFDYYLLLSQDHQSFHNDMVKEFLYGSDNMSQSASQAYITGQVQFEDRLLEKRSVMYAPLKGKQGVYGVLEVITPSSVLFPKEEVEFITLLANTAGSALENAKLYQQSQKLISDLQLINETSHRLNSNLRLSETTKFMSSQITRFFDADSVAFVLFMGEGNYHILPGSAPDFKGKQAERLIKYVENKIRKEKDSLFIADIKQKLERTDAAGAVMAVPMVHNELLKGAVIVQNRTAYSFTFEHFKLLQSLIHHSTLAFTNAMLREELETLVITDYLTKLHSRNYLDESIQASMKRDGYGTFIIMDIDNFKMINDTYGHQIGDEVLVQVSNIIKKNIRSHDIGARWGGEELAIYLPRVKLEDGRKIADRIVDRVANETNPRVTISCGIANWEKDMKDDVQYLVKRADQALYIAKQSGKNQVVYQKYE